ncbi:MAPEG family protein [Planktotalea sp.]|uniref:MAPEG family protein n=1 Tax=Planktotalea sp. TaxID=2029877 RepID=UPI00329749AC
MILPITTTCAALLGLISVPLTIHVSVRRAMIGLKSGKIDAAVFGHADDLMLRNSIRAFGNFVEYTPLALILLALLEGQGAPSGLVWGIGGAFVAGRVVHGLAMTFISHNPAPRGLAMLATYAAFLVPSIWMLTQLS